MCFMINKKWCDPRNISILSCSCSPHLEHLSIICRPFYLLREFHQSSLLLSTFHHRQTLAWLCPISTMCSADITTNILTLPSSSLGTLTKPTSRRSCRTFISIYSILSNQRTEYTRSLLHSAQKCLQSPLTAGFWQIGPCRHFPHTRIHTKDRSGTADGEGSDALVLPL